MRVTQKNFVHLHVLVPSPIRDREWQKKQDFFSCTILLCVGVGIAGLFNWANIPFKFASFK